ncbi:MAG TPA: RNA 2',3'-cyclic phosphodiesterase [Ktedonobacterales bacterium]
MPRIFVAIDPGPDARAELSRLLDDLRHAIPTVRWATAEQLHLTLAFLGEIAEASLAAVHGITQAVASAHTPFRLALGAAGAFGPERAPRVAWLGVTGDLPALHALRADLAARLATAGHTLDARPFSPHLTLARLGGAEGPQAVGALLSHQVGAAPWMVGALRVMQSETRPTGAVYTGLGDYPLVAQRK